MTVSVDDYVLFTADEIDFGSLESEVLEAIFIRFSQIDPDIALGAIGELSVRSVEQSGTRSRTADLAYNALTSGALKEGLFAYTLSTLYGCDRLRGLEMITRVIEKCADDAVAEAVDCLAVDLDLYRGEPGFQRALDAVSARLCRDMRSGRVLREDDLAFLSRSEVSTSRD